MRISFNWLKDYVDIRTSAETVAEKLTMVGLEVTSLTHLDQDTIMEIEVTPNRPDCLSVIGIAREVAAIFEKKLKLPKIPAIRGKSSLSLPIQIQNKKHCLRYLGRVIKNVKVGPSPQWLMQRLEVMGVRPVNNIVDITNFCLLEFGQPLHAFELSKLKGQKIVVRLAKDGEKIVTIDGVERNLDHSMLVIADTDKPQAIAGIMGSRDSEVGEQTTNILLESAYFNPLYIHHTARKLGLDTQSSYRFERGVDLRGVHSASLRAAELIQKLARPTKKKARVVVGRLIDKGIKKNKVNKVRLKFSHANEILGLEVSPGQIKEIMRKLNFSQKPARTKKAVIVNIPSFRADITREVDLIEEVARVYGYDQIPLRLSKLVPDLFSSRSRQLPSEETYHTIRQILAALGLNEMMSYSLTSRQALRKLEWPFENIITVKNPLSYEQEILRPTLLVGMLNALQVNINRKNTSLKLFELSRIYFHTEPQVTKESTNLCIGLVGKKSGNWQEKSSEYSLFYLKGIVEALLNKLGMEDVRFSEGNFPIFISGRSAGVLLKEEDFGFLGEIKGEILERFDISYPVYACELKVHKLVGRIPEEKRFLPLAKFPSVERDISLIAPQELCCAEIVSLIRKIGGGLVSKVALFDQYFGEQIPQGLRGLAYTIEYRSQEKTLTAEEVDKLHHQIRQALIEELKVQVR